MLRKTDIIYGNVKLQNILIFKDDFSKYVVKITNFGYSTIFVGSEDILILYFASVGLRVSGSH